MPRIDTDDMKASFKKKEYRAWDNNLLETLKIPKDNASNESGGKKHVTYLSVDDEVEPSSQSINTIEKILNNQKDDLGFNKSSIEVRLGFNQGSNKVPLEFDQGSIDVQSGFYKGSIGVLPKEQIRVQLGFNNDCLEIERVIKKLGGNEYKIFVYVIETCISKSSLSIGETPGKMIMHAIGTNKNGMETALKRLGKKGLILREKGKTGKNGLINLSISETIKNEAIKYIHASQFSNQGSIGVQPNHLIKVQLESKSSLYSNSNKYKTTTALPEEWKRINFTPLEDIGFSEQHLIDIYSTNLCDSTIVQESIYHFAFGLNEGRYKTYDSPLKVFIGRLRKGHAWIESNYESPKDKALRELLERKKFEKEKRDSIIKELVDMEFPEWRKKLTQDEIKQIVPSEILQSNIAPAVTSVLRTHFIDTILSQRLETEMN